MACPKKKRSYSLKKKKYNLNNYLKLNKDEVLKIRRWSDYYEYHSVVFGNSKFAKKYSIQLVDL
jgi:hypothetical protein